MRYLKLYENFNEESIHDKCEKYGIINYTINDDGSIDVDGDVNLSEYNLNKIPLNFRNVTGLFYCDDNQLTSLEGCPKIINDIFDCSNNKLTSLKGCPKFVENFYCNNNNLTSLKYCPEFISGDFFDCNHNNLTSLEHCPLSVYGFHCEGNKLDSLKFMPKCSVFNCEWNNIRDFKYFVEPESNFLCCNNPIFNIWRLFIDISYVELLNDYDCIRGEDIVINRLNQLLEDIDKPTVESVDGYNNI